MLRQTYIYPHSVQRSSGHVPIYIALRAGVGRLNALWSNKINSPPPPTMYQLKVAHRTCMQGLHYIATMHACLTVITHIHL